MAEQNKANKQTNNPTNQHTRGKTKTLDNNPPLSPISRVPLFLASPTSVLEERGMGHEPIKRVRHKPEYHSPVINEAHLPSGEIAQKASQTRFFIQRTCFDPPNQNSQTITPRGYA